MLSCKLQICMNMHKSYPIRYIYTYEGLSLLCFVVSFDCMFYLNLSLYWLRIIINYLHLSTVYLKLLHLCKAIKQQIHEEHLATNSRRTFE